MFGWLKKISEIVPGGGQTSKTKHLVKQELHATVIRACKKCGAGGVDKYGRDVGKICPKCGAKRPKPEVLGKIWEKWF